MIRFFTLLLMMILLSACSSSKVAYAWQGEAKAKLAKYQEMMLKGDFFQANYYLEDAIKEAKNDTSLESLAIVYLTQCAMQKAMAQKTTCKAYQEIKALVTEPSFEAYQKLLNKQTVDDRTLLGKYSSLYQAIQKKEVSVSDIKSLPTIYAQAIGSMVIFDYDLLTKEISEYMSDKASVENMKGLMLVWLKKTALFMNGKDLKRVQSRIRVLSH